MICLNKTTNLAFPVHVACQSEKLANFNYNGLRKEPREAFCTSLPYKGNQSMAFISHESSLQKPILIWFDDISIYACWYINVVVGIWCDHSSMLINSNQQLVNIILEERFEKYVIKSKFFVQIGCPDSVPMQHTGLHSLGQVDSNK